MQCFQLAKREHCKARIAKGELTWRVKKAGKIRRQEYPQDVLQDCRGKGGEKAHEYVNDRHNTAKK